MVVLIGSESSEIIVSVIWLWVESIISVVVVFVVAR